MMKPLPIGAISVAAAVMVEQPPAWPCAARWTATNHAAVAARRLPARCAEKHSGAISFGSAPPGGERRHQTANGPRAGTHEAGSSASGSPIKALSRPALAARDLWRVFSTMTKISYAGYRFPPEIIQQAIWLYLRFTLSFRDVEDLLAERGISSPMKLFGAG